jgi:hypothetical protein
LKGFMPYQGTYTFPHSLEWFYMSLKDSQTSFNTFDWTKLDKNLSSIAARGHQAVFGTFVDYPGSPSGMPSFLSGVPFFQGTSPDYNNPDLQTALLNYIAALGARYDNDPRVASVSVGLLGYWGEWHTFPNNWMPTLAFQNQVLDAYQRAFPHKQIVVREPKTGVNTDRPLLGFGDGSFGYETLGPTGWHFWPKIVSAGLQNIWKDRTISGEVRPEVQGCILDIPTCAPAGQDLDLSVKTTHASWLLYNGLFTGKFDAAHLQRATEAAQSLGYTLHIPQATLAPESVGQALRGTVTIENRGVAPFYYPWTVQMAALDTLGNLKTWSMDWDLRTVLPGSPGVWTFNVANPGLPSGDYTLLIGVPNPMTGGKALKFANTTQDQQRNGWLTIGSFVIKP